MLGAGGRATIGLRLELSERDPCLGVPPVLCPQGCEQDDGLELVRCGWLNVPSKCKRWVGVSEPRGESGAGDSSGCKPCALAVAQDVCGKAVKPCRQRHASEA